VDFRPPVFLRDCENIRFDRFETEHLVHGFGIVTIDCKNITEVK
jgi:hypothetical protein